MLLLNSKRSSKCAFAWRLSYVHYFTFLLLIVPYVTADRDPYEILGVKRNANLEQIKKAYRDLARKIHPDKTRSNEKEAERRFIELNNAFNILKDPSRRARFDQYGDTAEGNRRQRGHHNGAYQHQNRQTREYWAHNGFKTFTFFSSMESNLNKISIKSKLYHDEYVKDSHRRPFFIFFYSDFCPSCSVIESTWIKITEKLAKYGVGSFAIHVYQEPKLAQELGVSSIPHIACLLDGQIYPYHQSEISLLSIVKFTKSLLPNKLMPVLRDERDQDRFIASSQQSNRLSAIVFDNENTVKLRYLLLAYELRSYYRFGHVSTKLCSYEALAKQYNLSTAQSAASHILVFNEHIQRPVMQFSFDLDKDIDTIALKKKLNKWPFLKLPRLSSQNHFDDLCLYAIPREADKTRPRLCVVLFATETPSSQSSRSKMIEFIELNKFDHDERVAFAYLDPIKQRNFVDELLEETKATRPKWLVESAESSVILIERHPQHPRKSLYRWLSTSWNPKKPDELDRSKLELHQLVVAYKKSLFVPYDKVVLSPLFDEEGPSFMDRIFRRSIDYLTRLADFVISKESLSTMIIMIAFASMATLFLYNSPLPSQAQAFREDLTDYGNMKQQHNSAGLGQVPLLTSSHTNRFPERELKVIELKAETFNGLVRLLKPGHKTIVLLADHETKELLMEKFKESVWPYRRNKTLLFGYLCLDKNLEWYKCLLKEIVGADDLVVIKKNCIGTVLALNSAKHLRIYHAKHNERDYNNDEDLDDSEDFLGFSERGNRNNLESGDVRDANRKSNGPLCTVDNLLDGLPDWLDRLFQGLIKRYYFDEWPENMR